MGLKVYSLVALPHHYLNMFFFSLSSTFTCFVLLQDVFPIVPGDTDYRMFANDYGNIPGLDMIFLLGGYFYHTSYDTVERLVYALLLFWYS